MRFSPHFQLFYFNDRLDLCECFEWKIKWINNADLFSKPPLLIFTKGANISGGHCRQIDVTVILYVTVMKITLQCKLKNNRRKCPNIGFIFFFPYLYFFFWLCVLLWRVWRVLTFSTCSRFSSLPWSSVLSNRAQSLSTVTVYRASSSFSYSLFTW